MPLWYLTGEVIVSSWSHSECTLYFMNTCVTKCACNSEDTSNWRPQCDTVRSLIAGGSGETLNATMRGVLAGSTDASASLDRKLRWSFECAASALTLSLSLCHAHISFADERWLSFLSPSAPFRVCFAAKLKNTPCKCWFCSLFVSHSTKHVWWRIAGAEKSPVFSTVPKFKSRTSYIESGCESVIQQTCQ